MEFYGEEEEKKFKFGHIIFIFATLPKRIYFDFEMVHKLFNNTSQLKYDRTLITKYRKKKESMFV